MKGEARTRFLSAILSVVLTLVGSEFAASSPQVSAGAVGGKCGHDGTQTKEPETQHPAC